MSIYSSLHPVSFMLLRLSTNSFVVKSQLARVQQSRMCVGNSESVQVHSFCRDYNLEIVTELLQLVNLAIKKIVLSLKTQECFVFPLEFSLIYNGKRGRKLLVHLCPVLCKCEVFLEAAQHNCSWSPQAKES